MFSYYVALNGKILGYSPKVASSSIRRVQGTVSVRQAVARKRKSEGIDIVLFVRHPFERVVSAWHMLSRDGVYSDLPADLAVFDKFVEYILRRSVNAYAVHWIPQYQIHTYEAEFLPNRVFRLEGIDYWFPRLFGADIGRHNAATSRPEWKPLISRLSRKTCMELTRYYSADFQLFERAIGPVASGPS